MQYIIHFDATQTNAEKISNAVVIAGGMVHNKEIDFLVANLEFSQSQKVANELGVLSIEAEQFDFFE